MDAGVKKIIALVCAIICISTACAKASPEELPLSKSWDVSRKDNSLVQEFRIPHEILNPVIGAEFSLVFTDTKGDHSVNRLLELEKFTGNGSTRLVTKESADSENPVDAPQFSPDEEKALADHQVVVQHGSPPPGTAYILSKEGMGTIIPIHIVIEKIEEKAPEAIMDQVANTKGIYTGIMREIAHQKLEPGIYKLTLTPTQNIILPENVSTSLMITAMPKYNF